MAKHFFKRMRALPRQAFLACVVGLLFGCIAPALRASNDAPPAKSTVTIEQYEAELDRLSSAISNIDGHSNGIDSILNSLPSEWVVTARGVQFEVSSEWISGSLKDLKTGSRDAKERRNELEELAGQLQYMRNEAGRLSGTAQPANESSARAKLNHILSGREFQGMQSGESWIGRIWDQVQRWIEWILGVTIGRVLEKGPVRTAILWGLIVSVFLVIAVWVVRILTRMAKSEALRVEGAFPPGRNWREWAQEALAAARGRDYRTALHSAYWAGVYRLSDLGAWKLDQARTPREYLLLLKNPPEREVRFSSGEPESEAGRVSALAALTRNMESAWYGYIPATQQDFESAVDQLETLGCKLRSTAQTANS